MTTSASHAFDHAPMAICPFMPVFGPPAIMFERGRGTELWDSDGKRYLDFLAGIAVVSLGHSNPAVAEAIGDQARTAPARQQLLRQPGRHRGGRQDQRAAVRGHRSPGPDLLHATPVPRRTSARIKLARKHGGRGRHTVVSALGSFHGRTLATLAATGQPAKHEPFAPMPDGFRHVAWGDLDAMRQAVDGTRRRGADRADPGRGRRPSGDDRVPAGHPRTLRRDGRADDGRRDPDRLRSHRPLVRVRARRREPRRRDARQGDGQRHAGRRLLGSRRRRRGLPAGRPRQHLQRARRSPRPRSTRSSTRCGASTRPPWPAARVNGSSMRSERFPVSSTYAGAA